MRESSSTDPDNGDQDLELGSDGPTGLREQAMLGDTEECLRDFTCWLLFAPSAKVLTYAQNGN